MTSLDLSWNGFGMEGCHEMGKSLLRNRTLTHLDLSANRVSFDAFRQLLRGVVHNKVLKVLKVCKFSADYVNKEQNISIYIDQFSLKLKTYHLFVCMYLFR